jgi:type IV pilus assembly protein PilE
MQKYTSSLRNKAGFTLIELMVTVAIVAILAAIALPSYQRYILRGKRAAAQAQMMDIGNREQQFILANRTYADKSTLETGGYSLPSEVAASYDYDITVSANAVPSYTITFTAKNSQSSDGNLTLDSNGAKTPSDKW